MTDAELDALLTGIIGALSQAALTQRKALLALADSNDVAVAAAIGEVENLRDKIKRRS